MNKILNLTLICLFFTKIFAQKDPIEMAIESYDDKKINELIVYCKLLEKNKAEYRKLIEQKLTELQSKPRSCLNRLIHYGKALISGTLAVGSLGLAKEVFNKNSSRWHGNVPLGMLLASCGAILSLVTIDQICKGWTNCDEKMKYYKSLAIAKDLNNLDIQQN